MYKLLFETKTTIITNIMVLSLIGGIIVTFVLRNKINHWGYLIVSLAFYGLVICCFAAARDGLDLTIQNKIDGSCEPGIFKLISIPNIICSVCALIIIICGIVAICINKVVAREVIFFIMSCTVLVKIITIEVSRILLLV